MTDFGGFDRVREMIKLTIKEREKIRRVFLKAAKSQQELAESYHSIGWEYMASAAEFEAKSLIKSADKLRK